MENKENLIKKTKNLYNSLNLTDENIELIGNMLLNSIRFRNLTEFTEKNENIFLKKILENQDRFINPLFFLLISNELLRTVKTTRLFSELIINLDLLKFQPNCNHNDSEIVYKKRFSTFFPIHMEKEINYCKNCFIDYFENKINDNLPRITADDIIGIGVSGEKDSMAALKAICELRRKSNLENFNLIVCFIDEGINGPDGKIPYREICEESVKIICDDYNIPLNIYRYNEIFGFTVDDLYEIGLNPCNFDSQLLNIISLKFVYENKITKMLDILTEKESFQFACLTLEGMRFNLMPFSVKKLSKTKIDNHKLENYNIMLNIKDEENITYLKCTNTNYNSSIRCPYHQFNIGKLNSPLIDKMEEIHPGAITNFNRGFMKLISKRIGAKKIKRKRIKFCPICKLPSLGRLQKDCLVCNLKYKLRIKK